MATTDSAPDLIEPLEAWRVWRVVEREGELLLASIVKSTVWPVAEPLVARCLGPQPFLEWLQRRPRHEAPSVRCECGIYATALERSGEYLSDSLPLARARVLGRVALWGTVLECERGYRASYAYPLELYVAADASDDDRLPPAEVARRLAPYRVPVRLVDAERRTMPTALRGRVPRRRAR